MAALAVTIEAGCMLGLLGGERSGEVSAGAGAGAGADADAVAAGGCAVVDAVFALLSGLLSVIVWYHPLSTMSYMLSARTHPSSWRDSSSSSLPPSSAIERASWASLHTGQKHVSSASV